MAGRRILDAARLAQAARSVAKQHVALRSEQLDRYNKSSTVAKQAKYQSDRIVLTLQAAAALARRLAEDEKADPFGNGADSASPGDSPRTADPKSTTIQHERPASIHLNVDEQPGDGVGEPTAPGFNRNMSSDLSREPLSKTQRLIKLTEELDLHIKQTQRISELLRRRTSAEDVPNTASSSSATNPTAEHGPPERIIPQRQAEMRESR